MDHFRQLLEIRERHLAWPQHNTRRHTVLTSMLMRLLLLENSMVMSGAAACLVLNETPLYQGSCTVHGVALYRS